MGIYLLKKITTHFDCDFVKEKVFHLISSGKHKMRLQLQNLEILVFINFAFSEINLMQSFIQTGKFWILHWKYFFSVFLSLNFEKKLLSRLRKAHTRIFQNLMFFAKKKKKKKICSGIKLPLCMHFGKKNWKRECNIWVLHPLVFQNAKFHVKQKKLRPEMPY